jgi:hypothetical protein
MEFIKSPKNATVEEDQGHSFHCNIKRPRGCARKNVKVKWYHNGNKLLKKFDKGRNFKIKRSGAVLRFDNIRVENDGAYYCIVNCGCCSGSSNITMRAKSEKAYLKVEGNTFSLYFSCFLMCCSVVDFYYSKSVHKNDAYI